MHEPPRSRSGEPADVSTPSPSLVDPFDPVDLLQILEGIPSSTVVGFEAVGDDSIDLHVAELPEDARAGAAGLFCLVAPPTWTAVGVVVAGRTRRIDSVREPSEDIDARLVVTGTGAMASSVVVAAADGDSPADEPPGAGSDRFGDLSQGTPEGLMVDALHRAIGLASPGEAPPAVEVALGVWSHAVLHHLLEHGDIDWHTALQLHPGEPGLGTVVPSIETVVEATLRCAADLDWGRMHRRASRSTRPVAELSPDEAAWMDTTMFARWVIGSLPDPGELIRMLGSCCSDEAADGMREVVERVSWLATR